MASVMRQEPLKPTLLVSPPLTITQEQRDLVTRVLDLSSSDSRFSQKAMAAIELIMLGTNAISPDVSSLVPNTAVIGTPSFTLRVLGSGFNPTSVIIFNGFAEPTTYVSATEVTTGVNMAVWTAPSQPLPVQVQNGNVRSNAKLFKFNAP